MPNYLTISQAAKQTGKSIATIRRWIACGVIKSEQVMKGSPHMIPISEIEKIPCNGEGGTMEIKEIIEQLEIMKGHCVDSQKRDLIALELAILKLNWFEALETALKSMFRDNGCELCVKGYVDNRFGENGVCVGCSSENWEHFQLDYNRLTPQQHKPNIACNRHERI